MSCSRICMVMQMKNKTKRAGKTTVAFVAVLFLLGVMFLVAVNLGSLKLSPMRIWNGLFVAYDQEVATVYDLRFPRIIIAMLAGAALAVSGVLFQAVMKNPLADPGIIGISSGASFAAVLVTGFFPSLLFLSPLFAFAGGMIGFLLVYSLSWKSGLNPLRIILVGVAVNSMFTGLSQAMGTMSGNTSISEAASTISGMVTQKTWEDVRLLAVYVLPGLLLSLFTVGRCNLMALEDKTVKSLGVNVDHARIWVSMVAVLLASIATAVIGTIGFVGLIVPHIARLLVGSNHKVLLPFSAFLGAFVLLLADTLGRTIAAPYEISAGVVMAVIGGPFFIVLLRRSGKTYGN